MKLIDILVQELPKRGGWPEGADFVAQDGRDGRIKFGRNPIDVCLASNWNNEVWQGEWHFNSKYDFICHDVSSDWRGITSREQYEAALAASKTEWDGEGLPPVGTVCEGQFPRHPGIQFEWQECLVLYVFKRECAVKAQGTSTLHYCDEFRPIRSEADKKRDAAVESMFYTLPLDVMLGKDVREAIYDAIAAGKIPHIRID